MGLVAAAAVTATVAAAAAGPVTSEPVASPICVGLTIDSPAGHRDVGPRCLITDLSTLCSYPEVSVGTLVAVSAELCIPGG
jgi:hypothetical protein